MLMTITNIKTFRSRNRLTRLPFDFGLLSQLTCLDVSRYLRISMYPGAREYDAVSDLMHNWVPQRPDFKSALRVVKMVLNTQCYQYLWLTMWFHATKSEETLKKSKSLTLQCEFGSRAQKWPKTQKKRTDHPIAIYPFFFCKGWYT